MTARRAFVSNSKTTRRPADENRRLRLEIIAELDRLMAKLLDPAFTGSVEVLVPAKSGRIGSPHFCVKRFGLGPE
jgi:hypothetical protein